MKVAILHLSDFHFKSDAHVHMEKIEKLVQAIGASNGFDECIVVFSGDMTYHGYKKEFSPARYTLGKIIGGIKNRYKTGFIPLFTVPGNHDLKLRSDSRKHADIRSYYDDGTISKHLDEEFSAMDDYFAETFMNNKNWSNRLLYRAFESYGDFKIQFNLLNTAPFSTLQPDDKECHYFPLEDMHLLRKREESSLCITVMHHGLEWFDWSCKSVLEKTVYDNSEFLLTGHDHIGSGRAVSFTNDSGVWVSAAGAMDFTQYICEDSFNLVVIDTEASTFSSFMYTWNPANHMYFQKALIEHREIDSKSHRLQPRPSFMKDIKADTRRKLSNEFVDYFVFPKLSCLAKKGYGNSKYLQNYDEFYDHISSHHITYVDGEPNAGKSTLLRYIYIRLAEKAIPIIWDAANERMSAKRLIKHLFDAQYGDQPALYERYEQSLMENRYLIVDNWDVLSGHDKENYLEQLKDQFGAIILGRNILFVDGEVNVEESVREALLSESGESNILHIQPFFRAKRKELVRNVCMVSGALNESDIEQVNNAINSLVQNHASMFILNPEFIIQYTTYFSQEDYHSYSYQRGEKIFGTIFDYNIKSLILSATHTSNVDEYITVLEEIAYFMHSSQKDRLSPEAAQNIIETYNEQYAANVKARKFIDAMFKAKIFQHSGTGFDYAFSNRNYLSYFVARYIFRDFANTGNFEDVKKCIRYVCFGINADILLFIIYLSSNTRIVKFISKMAHDLMKDWVVLSLGANGMKLITQTTAESAQAIREPTQRDVQAADNVGEINEERAHDKISTKTNGIYDYDVECLENPIYRIRRGYAYTEMLAKALPAFSSILRADQKKELVEQIYAYPSKLVKVLLDPLDIHYDELIEQLLAMAQQMFDTGDLDNVPTREKIGVIMNDLAINITLSVMNHFAEYAVDTKTIALLSSATANTEVEKIQQLLIIENSGNTDNLYKAATVLLKEHKQAYMQTMVKCIVRKHLLNNTSIAYDKRQKIIDTIFGNRVRKQLTPPPIEKAI